MDSQHPRTTGYDAAAAVRQNTLSAAIAAALMIYYGFFALLEPTGTALLNRADLVFYHTIRIGGIAMALIAVWSMIGHRQVLIVDAVISVTIGAVFVLVGGAALMDGGGGLNTFLIIIFGVMFVSAGVRNGRVYRLITPAPHPAVNVADRPQREFSRPLEEVAPDPPDSSLASRLRHRATPTNGDQARDDAPAARSEESLGSVEPPASPVPQEMDASPDAPEPPSTEGTQDNSEPPADGFLASFADEEPPPRI